MVHLAPCRSPAPERACGVDRRADVDLKALSAIHFLHPLWLLALPPLLLLAVWLARSRGRDGNWSRIVDSDLLPLLRLSEKHSGHSPWPLIGSVWVLTVLALAGPAWTRLETPAF